MIRIAMITAALAAAAIPAAIPARAQGNGTRDAQRDAISLLRVTQMDAASQQIGVPQETRCPANGCQLASLLLLGDVTTSLQTVVTFAGQGIYIVLESPGSGTQIHLYGDPRPAPLFLPKAAGNVSRTVHIAIDKLGAGRQSRQLAAQDTYLRIEINQASVEPIPPRPAT